MDDVTTGRVGWISLSTPTRKILVRTFWTQPVSTADIWTGWNSSARRQHKLAAALLQTSAHQSDMKPRKTRTLSSRNFLTPSHTKDNFSSQSPESFTRCHMRACKDFTQTFVAWRILLLKDTLWESWSPLRPPPPPPPTF